MKRMKYLNTKVKMFGVTLDSKHEAERYAELLAMSKAGTISELQRQVRFEICPKDGDERAAFYVADFVYKRGDGKKVIEDVKSRYTKTLPLFRLKWKLMKHIYKDYILQIYE